MSYRIDPRLKSPPPELPPKERKRCAEEAKELPECLCLPVDGVESVSIKRVTVDIELKKRCD